MACITYGPRREKTCLWWFGNNKVVDQPAHPCSLISPFVICLLESIISKLATSKILIFQLVSVAEETGLSPTLSETPKTGFLASRPIYFQNELGISNLGDDESHYNISVLYIDYSF